jgi:hypothetical protein
MLPSPFSLLSRSLASFALLASLSLPSHLSRSLFLSLLHSPPLSNSPSLHLSLLLSLLLSLSTSLSLTYLISRSPSLPLAPPLTFPLTLAHSLSLALKLACSHFSLVFALLKTTPFVYHYCTTILNTQLNINFQFQLNEKQ